LFISIEPLPPPAHYDTKREIRNLGVGFYGFSQDEDTRKKQLEDLNKLRKDTLDSRSKVVKMKDARKEALEQRRALLKGRREKKLGRDGKDGGNGKEEGKGQGSTGDDKDENDVDAFLKGIRNEIDDS
jgi:hypothetical protein